MSNTFQGIQMIHVPNLLKRYYRDLLSVTVVVELSRYAILFIYTFFMGHSFKEAGQFLGEAHWVWRWWGSAATIAMQVLPTRHFLRSLWNWVRLCFMMWSSESVVQRRLHGRFWLTYCYRMTVALLLMGAILYGHLLAIYLIREHGLSLSWSG